MRKLPSSLTKEKAVEKKKIFSCLALDLVNGRGGREEKEDRAHILGPRQEEHRQTVMAIFLTRNFTNLDPHPAEKIWVSG